MAAGERKRRQLAENPEASGRPIRWGWAGVLVLFVLVLAAVWWGGRRSMFLDLLTPRSSKSAAAGLIEPEATAFAQYAGSVSCRECHAKEDDLWRASNHRWAERAPDPALDRAAFEPPRTFSHGTQHSEVRLSQGRYQVISPGFGGQREAYTVQRVIGHDPLRQFLVPGPRGRLQTLEASYDPHTNQWFNVYGDEDRRPGEWGHWTGRGMNWNSMCAACHNTRLRKNYDEATDTYHTTSAEMTVGCEACHGPMKDHVLWRQRQPDPKLQDPTIKPLNPYQILHTCASCHSRRLELTGDFRPGDAYFDHYALTIVDETDIYYPDGQVMGENYEFASFLSSRMHQAGVRCLDCHNPHSLERILPGNDLCMRCHNGGYPNSPIIDPAGHGQHRLDDTGGQCVGCHMPQTTYMQRHPRRDHGFTIPDPLLAQELKIPNACNRCHADKDVAWAIEAVDTWYGPRMDRHTRRRARWMAAARQGQATARGPMLQLLASDETPFWRAVAAGFLDRWIDESPVQAALLKCLDDPDALVRATAAASLEPLVAARSPGVIDALARLLADPMRAVRIRAAWALRATLDTRTRAGRELQHLLDFNADQPGGQAQKGAFALARHTPQVALSHYQKAVEWDPFSPAFRLELAVVLSELGRSDQALAQMQEACRLDPNDAESRYRLALAWNEVGQLDRALEALEATVRLDPQHGRAWYNLGLARSQVGQIEGALDALIRGERISPADPRIHYARATILLRQGRTEEARRAAEQALHAQPDFPAARELLEMLDRAAGQLDRSGTPRP
jgi:tetratricopeptide (TPR) repeat protein